MTAPDSAAGRIIAPVGGLIVGLTGGIGSGKSTVADLFAALGTAVVDADAIAHELTGPGGGAMAAIAAEFGPAVVAGDGRLDRGAMRERAFANPEARKRLEAILHPMIRELATRRSHDALEGGAPYVLLVVPLLVESGGYRERVARVAVVDCAETTQIDRVVRRSGLAPEAVHAIMAAQASRNERLAAADDVIDNDGSADTLPARIAELHAHYLRLAEATTR